MRSAATESRSKPETATHVAKQILSDTERRAQQSHRIGSPLSGLPLLLRLKIDICLAAAATQRLLSAFYGTNVKTVTTSGMVAAHRL